jgi:Bax protein
MSLLARSKRSSGNIGMIKDQIILSKINKFFKENKITISELQKYLKKKEFKINKKNITNQELINLSSLSRTFLSSLIIIFAFIAIPIVIDFSENKNLISQSFENDSKNQLKKLLEKPESNLDDALEKRFLFDDILALDDAPVDTVRLSAATIQELFKSTNYNLDDVRKNKLVKPVSLTLLPEEIIKIENSTKRKNLFIQIILPLIIKENNYIKQDRKKLFSILNKNKNSKNEKRWLGLKFKQYGVMNKDVSTLKIRMDEVPVSMAIAQAAKETGWGTSRFAQEGNALFGQWTWSGEGIKPAGADDDSTHKVMKFKILQASVKAYQRNLNTHSSYKEFRSARAELRDNKKELDSLVLSNYLDRYAETGKQYVKILQQIIRQNQLTDFDDAKLLPSSIELESLI